ncbi:MAG: serine/threonine protein kinase [Pirellula sp.]|nr:serine/threonine protein kinase [Pirellula sp.]
MNSEQYAKAKALFFDLVHLPAEEQNRRLDRIQSDDPMVAKEVRSLLANHSSRTIIGPTEKSGNTSTGSRSIVTAGWMRWNRMFVGGLAPLVAVLGAAIIIAILGWYLNAELSKRSREEYRAVVTTLARQKAKRVLQWSESYQLRVQDWGENEELQKVVAELNAIASAYSDSDERRKMLQDAEKLHQRVSCVFDMIASRPLRIETNEKKSLTLGSRQLSLKYAIWNSSFQLLADWQYKSARVNLGSPATADGKLSLSKVFETKKTHVVLPQASAETFSVDYPIETNEQYVMFFVPIFEPTKREDSEAKTDTSSIKSIRSKEVIGAMMVRSDAFLHELQEILSDRVLEESNCYLVNSDAAISTMVLDSDKLLAMPHWSKLRVVRDKPVMLCLDPGVDVLRGRKPAADHTSWPRTVSARSVTMKADGHNLDGYRDYRGKEVVGAWLWVEELHSGLILEVPKEVAFRNLHFVSRTFLFLLSIPLLCAFSLVGVSLVRKLRTIELVNRTVGPYRLKEKLGEGGLGVVHRGEHRMLGRSAAVKLIKQGSETTGSVRRFEREVRLAAGLNHPNAVCIYDFGISKDGMLFCAMELVDGLTLAQLISFSPHLPLWRSLSILCQTSGVLAEAHNLGLVHRDIKPQNVMLCRRYPATDAIKVVDFGLAKNISDTINSTSSATRVVMGTPGFIAPERLESPWIADPKIDTFAFGVLGLYLLSGKVPTIGTSKDDILALIQNPELFDVMDKPEFQELIKLLIACAAPSPSARPGSMNEVNRVLERLADSSPFSRSDAENWWSQKSESIERFKRFHH